MSLLFLKENLIGVWKLKRKIEPNMSADGHCHIYEQVDGQFLFDEKCTITSDHGESWLGERQYVFKFGTSLDIYFVGLRDGLFVNLVPNESQQWCGVHICEPDVYRMTLKMNDKDCFETIVEICGPNKNYQIFSQYRRTPLKADFD